MVGFSYCFSLYQQLAILFERKDLFVKKAKWLALGLWWEEPLSISETRDSGSMGNLELDYIVEDWFFKLE